MTPILARSLTWVEVGRSASIIFDLRIAAVTGEPEAETKDRFVTEAIRLAGAFLLGNRSSRRLDTINAPPDVVRRGRDASTREIQSPRRN